MTMKRLLPLCTAFSLALAACGTAPENDPIYQALKANPPTEIPAKHLPRLRRGAFACDVYNEGQARQYMTCWWPQDGMKPVQTAYLSYFPPSILRPPNPSQIMVPGGKILVERIKVN